MLWQRSRRVELTDLARCMTSAQTETTSHYTSTSVDGLRYIAYLLTLN
jgi:hypothetical protein